MAFLMLLVAVGLYVDAILWKDENFAAISNLIGVLHNSYIFDKPREDYAI
jgi:hypothetical protein